MRVGAVHFLGGMMMRIPLWRLPRMEPPRASTMKLTRNLQRAPHHTHTHTHTHKQTRTTVVLAWIRTDNPGGDEQEENKKKDESYTTRTHGGEVRVRSML